MGRFCCTTVLHIGGSAREEGLWAAGGKPSVSETNRQIVVWLVSRLVSGLVRTDE